MHMKRFKYIVICTALLLILLLATGCGSGVSLSASMSGLNETEETTDISDEDEESADIEEYDYEYADDEEASTGQTEESQTTDGKIVNVVINTNPDRKRIHIPGTSCAKQIHEENYLDWTGTEEELLEYAKENGYVACGRCHPDTKLGIDLPK